MSPLQLTVRSDPSSIRSARDWIASVLRASPNSVASREYDITVIVSELVTNAIEHGDGSDVHVVLDLNQDEASITVLSGRKDSVPILLPQVAGSEHGRGMYIVRSLSQSLVFISNPTRISVCARVAGNQRNLAAKLAGMAQQEVLHISTHEATLTLVGELDASNADACEVALQAIEPIDGEVVIDLSGVTFIDSSGLRIFARAHRRAQDTAARVVLLDPSPQVQRLLTITGLTDFLSVSQSR